MGCMDAKVPDRRWYLPAPAWLVWGAVAATVVLATAERWRWFFLGQHKGYAVLVAVAVVGAVLVLIPMWMLVALLFRRRAQFGLATLLVFVTLSAVLCSWLAIRIKQARRQAAAVAVMNENAHAQVNYDWQLDDALANLLNTPPPEPERLVNVLGVDFFHDVEWLYSRNSLLTDAEMEHVAQFTRLTWLILTGQEVTDSGLSHLERLSNLQTLELHNTRATDERVERLQRVLPECQIDVWRNGQLIIPNAPPTPCHSAVP
jgi:hypothetical protein